MSLLDFLLPYLIMFIAGVAVCWVFFFRTNKADKLNLSPDETMMNQILTLQTRVKLLEQSKPSKLESMEIRDTLRLVRDEQQKMREDLMKNRERISELVMNLLASYRPREKSTKGKTNA